MEIVTEAKAARLIKYSELSFAKRKGEWTGTQVVFEITRIEDKTAIRFTHVGLVTKLECYGACSVGWNYYLHKSLLPSIATGKGIPD